MVHKFDDPYNYQRIPPTTSTWEVPIGPIETPFRYPHALGDPSRDNVNIPLSKRIYYGKVELLKGHYVLTWNIDMLLKSPRKMRHIEEVTAVKTDRYPNVYLSVHKRRAMLEDYLSRRPTFDRVYGLYGDHPEVAKLWRAYTDVVLSDSFFRFR